MRGIGSLLGENQAQLINYLKASGLLVGLLVNFGKKSGVQTALSSAKSACRFRRMFLSSEVL